MSTPENTSAVAAPKREKLIVHDNSAISYLMDTAKFEHCYRIARLMATASLIPDHLRMNMKTKEPLPPEQVEGNCFMIVNQSLRWGFDPFAVAPETYIVGGKLAYQGKLVGAAINELGGLVEDLRYEFSGNPGSDDFTITVIGQKAGEDKPRTVTVSVGQAKTDNQMWKKDPEQKLVYTGNIKWARRHCPGVIMGVMIQEDLEEIQMREATGRVIDNGTSVADRVREAVDSTPTEPAPAEPKPARTRRAAAPKEAEAPAATEEPAATAEEPQPEMPSRVDMVAAIKESWRKAEITQGAAEAIYRANGLLRPDQTLGPTTDLEVFAIYNNRGVIFKAGGAQ